MNKDYEEIIKKHETLIKKGETSPLTDRFIKFLIQRLYEERTAKNCYKRKIANLLGADPEKYFNCFDNEQPSFKQQIIKELDVLIEEESCSL